MLTTKTDKTAVVDVATCIDDLRDGTLRIVNAEAPAPPPPLPTVATTTLDLLLGRLRDASSMDDVQFILREIGHRADGADDLARACLREQIITILGDRRMSAPARMADAVLPRPEIVTSTTSIVPSVEPWDQAVDGADLLRDLSAAFARYVVLLPGAADALALWGLHTHVYGQHTITPRLLLTSPEKRCGKTTVLSVLAEVCARPLPTANLTAAVIYRVVESAHPTLLIDEADTFLGGDASDIRGIINAGHRRGGVVLRCEGDNNEPRAYDCYAPVAIAAIGRIPDTITDRSITIPMRRRQHDEHVDRLRLDRVDDLRDLARQAARWAADHGDDLDLDPPMPDALHDRAADNWRVLLSIADRVGGEWPERARSAALALSAAGAGDDESTRVMLLGDIRGIFDSRGVSRISTTDLLADLVAIEERPWGEWTHGRPMTAHSLSRQLRPFGIRPVQYRDPVVGKTRGYDADDLREAWGRYL